MGNTFAKAAAMQVRSRNQEVAKQQAREYLTVVVSRRRQKERVTPFARSADCCLLPWVGGDTGGAGT